MKGVTVRLAARQIATDRRRFLLLLAAICLPIVAITAWFVLRASSQPTIDVAVRQEMGQARTVLVNDSLLRNESLSDAVDDGLTQLAAAGVAEVAVPVVTGSVTTEASGSALIASLEGRDANSVFEGRRLLQAGQWATDRDQVVVSPALRSALNIDVGDSAEIAGRPFRVVGVAIDPNSLDARFVMPTFDTGLGVVQPVGDVGNAGDEPALRWFLTEEGSPSARDALATTGWQVQTRDELREAREAGQFFDNTNIYLAGLSVVVLGELMLIFAAVYSLVLRAREREFALLGVLGAPERLRRRVSLIDGVVLGTSAAGLGIALGVFVAWLGMPRAAALANQHWEQLRLPWGWLAGLAIIVVASAGGASRLAVNLVRSDSVAVQGEAPQLARDGVTMVRRPWIWGLALATLFVGGLALRSMGLLGAAALLLASLSVRGLWVWYSTGKEVSGGPRRVLARRTLSLRPARSALFAGVPLSVVLLLGGFAGVLGGVTQRAEMGHVAEGPVGSAIVESTKPLSRAGLDAAQEALGSPGSALFTEVAPTPVPIDDAGRPYTYWGRFVAELEGVEIPLYTAEARDVEVLLGRSLTASEGARYSNGELLSFSQEVGPTVRVTAPSPTEDEAAKVTQDLVVVNVGDAPAQQGRVPVLVVAPETASAIGMPQPNLSLGYLGPPENKIPSHREEAAARGAVAADVGLDFMIVSVERGSTAAASLRTILLWSMGCLLLASTALAVLMVNLMVHEGKRDLDLLSAVGADRSSRASFMAWQSAYSSGLGAVLGISLLALCLPSLLYAANLPFTMWPLVVGTLSAVVTGGVPVLVTVFAVKWWSRSRKPRVDVTPVQRAALAS